MLPRLHTLESRPARAYVLWSGLQRSLPFQTCLVRDPVAHLFRHVYSFTGQELGYLAILFRSIILTQPSIRQSVDKTSTSFGWDYGGDGYVRDLRWYHNPLWFQWHAFPGTANDVDVTSPNNIISGLMKSFSWFWLAILYRPHKSMQALLPWRRCLGVGDFEVQKTARK